ncbi:ABC transporter ATP-binding protein [Paenibacillus sp. J31TS4]|uniref:ABC transporter ATP-binding protein n=1 Tax=Paenibacillus sp. J31TS4 TaxID=2807195 RepID=UPI001B1CAE8C|nr:ABC transporter ATP-binding protein [Paenibacillus sp. J31TS4]GIP39963.1 ABC transporter ATP-binding protein [Paenibacillus sp. J31TS4]
MSYNNEFSISIENVSKCYKIYNRPQDRLKQGVFPKRKYYQEFWALKDVSFKVKKGETIGIIGRNGSGKSTVLQIITNTLEATEGNVNINGRIAALLELGSGFNPEFTGRENVYMNGAIMGLSKREIEDRMGQIEEFADIGMFIDQPVKVYSSGMYVRLAFACAINVDPDILIVDEALAVGDMQFQLKCINRMKEFKEQGKTILFVSHDTYSIRNFCDQVIWMMDGEVHLRGEVNQVTRLYEDYMKSEKDIVTTFEQPVNVPDEQVLTIDSVSTVNADLSYRDNFRMREDILIMVDYTLHKKMEGIVGGVAIFNNENISICGLNTKLDAYPLPNHPGKYTLSISYDDCNLLPGTYFIDVGFFESSGLVRLDYKARIASFRISSSDYIAEGVAYLKHKWTCTNRGAVTNEI